MKKWKILSIIATIAILSIGIYATFVSAINIVYDFEDGNVPSWTPLYSNANMTVEEETSGNKYLKLSYNGAAHRDRAYYDVKVADISGSGILQADYDVMYTENTTEKNGECQMKLRTGPGSAETKIVARVAKHLGYFRTQGETGSLFNIKGLNNSSLPVEVGRWYSVKLIVDLDNGKQSIYIFDRDTKELLSYSEPTPTVGNNKKVNMVTFSSGTDMCIDNVKIYNTTYESGYIYGSPYVSSGTKTKYYMWGLDSNGNYTALPEGTVEWTLETPRTGVTVDSPTGRIIVGSQPEPGPVIIRADKTTAKGTYTARFVVNVSR